MSEQSTNVEHAEIVQHADHTDQADRVTNAASVGTIAKMDLHIDSVGSTRMRWLKLARDLLLLILAAASMACLIIVFLDKQSDQNQFLAQSKSNADAIAALTADVENLQDQLAAARRDLADASKEDRLANDCVDFASATLSGETADLVVALASTPPGTPERSAAIAQIVSDIEVAKDYVLHVVQERPSDCPPFPLAPGTEP